MAGKVSFSLQNKQQCINKNLLQHTLIMIINNNNNEFVSVGDIIMTYFAKLTISNSHSSSSQAGDSNSREMSISCTSRGVARASNPWLTWTQKIIIN